MLEHLSYSQYNTYVKCPRSWYLGKVVQAEEIQTWYIPIGSAVHAMIEEYLSTGSDTLLPAEDFFFPLIERQMLIEPDLSKWLAGGPADHPITEERALQRARECFEKAVEELEHVDVWEVEYDASGHLPGLDVPIKAFLDIVGEHDKKGPVIWDWKTGSTKPGNFQLETYAALLKVPGLAGSDHPFTEHGSLPFHGRYVMLAPGSSNARHVDLSTVDPAEVGAKYQVVYEQMKQKIYKTDHGFNCRFCFHQENCLVNAGPTPRAKFYDKAHEDGYPF